MIAVRPRVADDNPSERPEGRSRGQILVMFALGASLFIGILAVVIDVGNIWNASLRVQRAAEAAALAGVPYMPGDFTTATTKARTEATKNGFTAGSGTTVTPAINTVSNRRLDVTISKPYGTFFLRYIGFDTLRISYTATAEYSLPVPMGSPLSVFGDNSGKFWGAIEAQGTNRREGDGFATYYNPNPTLNADYDGNGYHYAIDVPAGAGSTSIDLYDPIFCAVDALKGTGDRWMPWDMAGWPAQSIYFRLWSDPAATPLDYSDDVIVAQSGTLFENKRHVDKSAALREDNASWPGNAFWSLPDCQADIYHNRWWTLGTVTTPGRYRLQVQTTDPLNANRNLGVSGANMWGLRAVSSSATYKAQVYGLGKIVIYANATAGTTVFYLARIEAVHAGKTMVIQLFDPGDASGNASLEILKPTATGYSPATFSFTADANASCCRSGTNITSLPTTVSGTQRYQNSWVTITVPLPTSYTAPLPPGEPAGTMGGWWKIRYTFSTTTHDLTTWQVSIRGNPVHLIHR